MNKHLPLILIVCSTIYFYPITSLAQKFDPDSEEGKAFNNESSEFVTCASFYGVLMAQLGVLITYKTRYLNLIKFIHL